MKKNTYKVLLTLIFIIYILYTNIFNLIFKNEIKFISFNIINFIYLILIFSCIIISNIIFKKNDFKEDDNPKNFRKKISEAVSNSFVITTIFTTLIILLLYQFLEKILFTLNIKTGIIHHTMYSLKIFFVSLLFIRLEITILR